MMNNDFRITLLALTLPLSDKVENYGLYATTHPAKPTSMQARLLACIVSVVFVLILGLLATSQLAAQIATGSLSGTIHDSSGAVVPGAQLTLTNNATGVPLATVSTSTGTYLFPTINPGTYTLKVTHAGFGDYVTQNIIIHVQQINNIDVPLSVGSQNQQVKVTAAAPLLQTQDASVGQTIEGQEINDLPLVNRNWTSLAQLNAGVTTANPNFGAAPGSSYFNINGNIPWQNDFRLDGVDDNIEVYGGFGANITPPPDAISEFKLQAGDYSAEFGHSTSGVINALLKSGTNQFHGDLWEYLRNTNLNADDYFYKLFGGTVRQPYHQNDFGGTIGGPVWIPKIYSGRNKTFFFFDYQANLISTPQQYSDTVPTALMQSSGFSNLEDLITNNGGTKSDGLGRVFPFGAVLDPATTRAVAAGGIDPVSGLTNPTGQTIYVRDPFYAGGSIAGITDFTTKNPALLNQIPAGRIDPNAVKVMGVYPAANQSGFFNDYFQSPGQTNNTHQYDVRIDENPGPNDTIFGVWDWSNNVVVLPSALPGIADGNVYGTGNQANPIYMIVGGWTHVFAPTLTNEFHAGYSNYVYRVAPTYANETGIPQQYGIGGIPQVPGYGGLPRIQISGGLTNLGASELTYSSIRALELMDNLTKVHGSHTFKVGMQFNRFGSSIIQSPAPLGQFSYGGLWSDVPDLVSPTSGNSAVGIADFLLSPTGSSLPAGDGGIGNLGGLSNWQGSNIAPTKDLRYYWGAYFQDDWKATENLTLNLGLRWDYTTPYAEVHGRQANFIQSGDGDGSGPATYYMPKQGCKVPRSAAFDALLASSGITLDCISNNAVGLTQKGNFAPRVGFAYRIKPTVVVRGGYGITYGALDNIGFYGNIGNNYPFSFGQSQFATNSETPFTSSQGQTYTLENTFTTVNLDNATQVSGAGVMLNGRQYNFQTPYNQTANLAVQDQFTNHDAVQVGYVGIVGRHLDTLTAHNVPSIMLPPGTNTQLYAPFPAFNYSNSQWEGTNASSSYNSLQATYQHQTSYGLDLLANYTWSKCMSNQNYNGSVATYRAPWLAGFGIKGDYGLCDADTTHVVHVSGTYKLPVGRDRMFANGVNRAADAFIGGWVVNGIYTFQSGSPISVGCPNSTTADFGCFANRVPGQGLYTGGHKQIQWLNPNAFAQPAAATAIGQSDYSPLGGPIYVARGPVLDNIDASVFKQFSIVRQTKLEFRAEAFNLFNHTELGQPGNNAAFAGHGYQPPQPGNPNPSGFSEITYSRNSPRILQLALKLYY